MAKQRVTLKADLPNGTFFWVTEIEVEKEEDAVIAAEEMFLSEVDSISDWHFSEYEISKL